MSHDVGVETLSALCLIYVCLIYIRELSRFIAAGRLHCKIDKVNEIVETNRYRHLSVCLSVSRYYNSGKDII